MLPPTCQMLLFSATFEESVWNFAQRIVPDPNIIKLKREEETLDTIKQYFVLCNSKEEKFQALCNIYGAITIAQAMIFCHVSSSSAQPFLTLHTTVSVSISNNKKNSRTLLQFGREANKEPGAVDSGHTPETSHILRY